MAVIEAPAPVRVPGVGVFVRMKLRIIGNGLVFGGGGQVVAFVMSCVFGAVFVFGGVSAFIASSAASERAAVTTGCLVGAVIVGGWIVMPTLFFGVDETLDPARFALLPLTKARIALGMGTAALVGVAPVSTGLVFLAYAITAGLRSGPVTGLVALVGIVLTLAFCVLGSRAVTSAFAGALRGRRTRDVATVLLALIAGLVGPLAPLASQALILSGPEPLEHGAGVIGWTPFGAGFAAPYDVVAGHPLVAVERLGLLLAVGALAAWWWSTTFEGAMVGVESGGRASGKPVRGGAVAGLIPVWLRVGRVGPFRAVVARELRYWFRDNRRRIALLSSAISGLALPVAWSLQKHGLGGGALPFMSAFSAWIAGIGMFQVFSMDGTAYATHLLAGVPAKTDVRARVAALSLIMLPVLVTFATVVSILHGTERILPLAYGTLVATFGVAVGASVSFAVDGAYPMPETRNPFAMRTGTATGKSMLMFAVMALTLVGTVPMYILAYVLPRWTVLPLGLVWGLAGAFAGSSIAAARLARRGPELLMAVTPRR
jgi:ABC-2 type transport system permease protein